jgi:hypothetical protein
LEEGLSRLVAWWRATDRAPSVIGAVGHGGVDHAAFGAGMGECGRTSSQAAQVAVRGDSR